MGRNRKNITIQLNKRIDELLRIGEKKVKVDGRVDGIHSVQTAGCYRGTANRLGEVCKSMGIRSIEDIDKGVIERYMESYYNKFSRFVNIFSPFYCNSFREVIYLVVKIVKV